MLALLKACPGFRRSGLVGWMLGCWLLLVSGNSRAEGNVPARIVPVLEVLSYQSGRPRYGLAENTQGTLGKDRTRFARALKQVLVEAVQDLDLDLDLSERVGLRPEAVSEAALVEWAESAWVIVPVIAESGYRGFEVTLLLVPPGSDIVLSKSQTLKSEELEVRVMLMVRDLIRAGRRQLGAKAEPTVSDPAPVEASSATAARSPGRAILSVTAAAVGGYTGFALQRASGSEDVRLTYPLAALGAGVGLGTAIVVADEWDISTAEAWYLSAGALWPNLATTFLADGYGAEVKDRYVWGLLGSGVGLTLAATAVSQAPIGDGGALVLHSSAGFGVALGSLTEFMVKGRTGATPKRGIGFGSAAGALLGGALATQVEFSSSRVLMLDLGVALGGLGAAAAFSPLLIVDRDENRMRNRLWLGGIVAGMATGGVVAYFATDDAEEPRAALSTTPYVAPVGDPTEGLGFSAGLMGTW